MHFVTNLLPIYRKETLEFMGKLILIKFSFDYFLVNNKILDVIVGCFLFFVSKMFNCKLGLLDRIKIIPRYILMY